MEAGLEARTDHLPLHKKILNYEYQEKQGVTLLLLAMMEVIMIFDYREMIKGLSINNLEKMLSFWYAFLQWRQAYEREIMGSV